MQIDIGFGDIVYPEPEESNLPTMLNSPVPRLLCYSRESTIAEKFEAMVKLGILNSRMKGFYDIWLLSRQFDFDGARLAKAIRLTFEQRGTTLPSEIEAFTDTFIDAKQTQWTAFSGKDSNKITSRPHSGKSLRRWKGFSHSSLPPSPQTIPSLRNGQLLVRGPEPGMVH